jgi:hypothetical protein
MLGLPVFKKIDISRLDRQGAYRNFAKGIAYTTLFRENFSINP